MITVEEDSQVCVNEQFQSEVAPKTPARDCGSFQLIFLNKTKPALSRTVHLRLLLVNVVGVNLRGTSRVGIRITMISLL